MGVRVEVDAGTVGIKVSMVVVVDVGEDVEFSMVKESCIEKAAIWFVIAELVIIQTDSSVSGAANR